MLTAINHKNQAKVKKAATWLFKYNQLNIWRDQIEGEFGTDHVKWRYLNTKCEETFDKFETALEELPKYEQKSILNSNLY
jgi:hypothetical protein